MNSPISKEKAKAEAEVPWVDLGKRSGLLVESDYM